MEIVYRNITELIFADYNPRQITFEQMGKLKLSMSEFGIVEPALVNMHPERLNIVIGGEQRIHAAQTLGQTVFPCIEVSMDLVREKELNVRLNKNRGKFDYEKLLKEFSHDDLVLAGFTDEELLSMSSSLNDDPKGLDKADQVYKYDLIFESAEQLERFRQYLGGISAQVKRTEQTQDLVNYLIDGQA